MLQISYRALLGCFKYTVAVAVFIFLFAVLKLDAALLGHWALDEANGSATAVDSENGYNGTTNGTTEGVAGKLGTAYAFDGGNDWVEITSGALMTALSGETSFTVSFWASGVSFEGADAAFSVGDDADNDGLAIYPFYQNGKNDGVGVWWDGGMEVEEDHTHNADGTYYLFTFIARSNTDMEFYVDGVSIKQDGSTNDMETGLDRIRFGGWIDDSEDFEGNIDDVVIYDEPLTDDELTVLYEVGDSASLAYNGAYFDDLKQVHDAGTGEVTVGTETWMYKTGLTQAAGLSGTSTIVFNDAANTGLVQVYNDLYWDLDGTTAGSGDGTPDGTWDITTDNWNPNSAGTDTTVDFVDRTGTTVHFAAGTDGTGTYSVTVSGTRTVGGIHFDEGTVSLTTGTISFANVDGEIDVDAGLTATISATIAGTAGWSKTDTGTLNLTGTLSNTGNIDISGGTVNRNGGGVNDDFYIAETAGVTQRVTVRNGADLVITDKLGMSETATSNATLIIDGNGSSVTVAGYSNIGDDGTATLTIQNGGDFIHTGAGGQHFRIGNGITASGDGLVSLTGNGSTLDVQGAGVDIIVGNNSGNGTLVASNTAAITISDELRIADDAASTGQVTIQSGATLTATGNGKVARRGTGSMLVTGSNSTFTVASSDIYVGEESGANGLLTVAAGGQMVNNGANSDFFIGYNSGSVGSVVISGNGTTALFDSVDVGYDSAADNEMIISNSAVVTAADVFDIAANATTSKGAVSVVTGADLTTNSLLYVGKNGTGVLTVDGSGSTVTAAGSGIRVGESAGALGTVTVSGGATLTNSGWADIGTNGTGNMVVTGSGSTFNISSILLIGEKSGSNGSLTVEAGGLLNKTGTADLKVGEEAGSIGSLVVTGAGTTALIAADLVVGEFTGNDNMVVVADSANVAITDDLIIGDENTARGTVSVVSGGDMSANGTFIGGYQNNSTGTGTLVVTGSGSSFTDGADDMAVGYRNKGTMTVSAGALFTDSGTLKVGRDTGAIGTLTVTGNGTTADLATVWIGEFSTNDNTIIVADNARLDVDSLLITRNDANARGSMTIQSGADVVTTGTAYVGNSGTGALTIDGAGSTFTGTTVEVGNNAGSVGTLTLSNGGTIDATTVNLNNAGTTFVADTIAIGNAAAEIDTLNINANTTATATTIDIGSGGTLNLNRSDGIIGASAMNLSGGTFDTNGNDQAAGGLGNLTMSASSTIDMGASTSIIQWAVIDEGTWTGTLSIHNWTGTRNTAGGTDQLIFTDITGFNGNAQVSFFSGSGSGLISNYGKFIDIGGGRWELVPAPEASTWVGIGTLIAFVVFFELRRRKQKSALKQEVGAN